VNNKHFLLGLSLALSLLAFSSTQASAAESAWQGLTSGLSSGLSGTVHNCSPLTVANGSVAAYPSCAITCDSGFNLSGQTCVAQSGGGPSIQSFSGGGGGGGGSSLTFCTAVSYSAWGACTGGLQNRTVLSSSPSGCTLTTTQQQAVQQSCTVVTLSGGSALGMGMFKSKSNPGPGQVLGSKTYPDFSALRDSKTGAIYVIYKDGKYRIKNLKELALYKIKKTISVDTSYLATFKDLAKYPVVPKKK
jgi:hypothetical protein